MKQCRLFIATFFVVFAAAVTAEGGVARQDQNTPGKHRVTERSFLFAQVRASRDTRTLDLAFWNSITTSADPADFRAYLAAFPKGAFAAEARARSEGAEVITPTAELAEPRPDIAAPRVPRPKVSHAYPPPVFYDIARQTENRAEAAELYRMAADAGDTRGAVELASLYERGAGVPQSVGDSLRWYRFAADRGDALGQHNLARLYETGIGVDRNMGEALQLYEMAADQGLELAATALRRLATPGAVKTRRRSTTAPVDRVHLRCADILIGAQLGELSEQNKVFLQEECGR